MITSLEQATETLIRHYQPSRIILFGSHAAGTADDESDFDLLVVKPTHRRPLERQTEVDRLLAPRSIALDLVVYTPQEFRQLFLEGNPLVEEIVNKGQVRYMRKETQTWLDSAADDLHAARLLCGHSLFRAGCYHSQQCVEKTLKALILESGVLPRRTHDLLELQQEALGLSWTIPAAIDDVVFLNNIYRGRYPAEAGLLPQGEPTLEECTRALRLAGEILEKASVSVPTKGE
jgi:HEPN domain-containing protein/predicted nucleotidyltransferase